MNVTVSVAVGVTATYQGPLDLGRSSTVVRVLPNKGLIKGWV